MIIISLWNAADVRVILFCNGGAPMKLWEYVKLLEVEFSKYHAIDIIIALS